MRLCAYFSLAGVVSPVACGSEALAQPSHVKWDEKQDVAGSGYKNDPICMLITKKQAKKRVTRQHTLNNEEFRRRRREGSEEMSWWEVLFFYVTAGGSQACSHGQQHSLQHCTERGSGFRSFLWTPPSGCGSAAARLLQGAGDTPITARRDPPVALRYSVSAPCLCTKRV